MELSESQQVMQTLAPITLEAWDSAGFEGTRASVISLMHIYKHNSFVSVACYFIIYLFVFLARFPTRTTVGLVFRWSQSRRTRPTNV
ncbi:TPA_asm: hypothetical protein [Branchiostoma lancelet adintovirus]|uniref:Uncharacterized protein n=1 Tax=Branchiostoma lancelet adintovirus TaxID=2597807 RepID=A0A5H3CVR4_9VIRU|nr:TPA_asm: hypothetical protein [Branchiostoma lancelet adintovirus]